MNTKRPHPPLPDQPISPPGQEADMDPRPQYWGAKYQPANKLQDKVALITGGDSGIGRAVATLFAREGADIAIVYLPAEQQDAEETQRVIANVGRRTILIPGDVQDPQFCDTAVRTTIQEFGKLDILVNNAAVQKHRDSIEELSFEQWDHTFKTNIYGYFFMVKAALPHLGQGGVIINTGSETGLAGSKRLLDYSATKGAIHAFTKSLAQNLIERGIRVNCVAPGPIWTPLNPAERSAEETRQFGGGTPIGRPGQPEEVAPAYVYLASSADSSYVTGEVLSIMGGATTAG